MKDMWAYVYDSQKVKKKRVARPVLRPKDVLVQIDRVSICGSDFHIFANDDWAKESISPGMVIGHEGCGTVVEVGEEVQSMSVGDYVALESHYACPECEKEGKDGDSCPHYGIIGVHGSQSSKNDHETGGVFAEFIAIPHYCCYPVTEKIRDEMNPSLLEPAGNSWEIIRYLREYGLPRHLAVYGCGPHGLNMQLFARHAGIKNIVAFETDPWRLDYAKDFAAAHHVINPRETSLDEILSLTNHDGFDVAIDMVGNLGVVESCKDIVRDRGMVILFGLPSHEALIAHGENFSQIIFNNEKLAIQHKEKNITLRGFTGRTRKTWVELLEALDESAFLREKLSQPLKMMGSLHDLESFIHQSNGHYLKVGLRAFNNKLT